MTAPSPTGPQGNRDPRLHRLFVCVALLMARCWIDQQRRTQLHQIATVRRPRASRLRRKTHRSEPDHTADRDNRAESEDHDECD